MNTIKITSGKYRGRSIQTPGDGTHPMGAREKLALFNTIANYLPGATVLDAYAGSGALGIEALSRGASRVDFVEKNQKAIRTIQDNLASLELLDISKVFKGDVKSYASPVKYNIILADPPYDDFRPEDVRLLARLLEDGGVFVLSHPDEAPEIERLELAKTSKYAAAHLSLYYK